MMVKSLCNKNGTQFICKSRTKVIRNNVYLIKNNSDKIRLFRYDDLFKILLYITKFRRYTIDTVTIPLTKRCNLSCPICYEGSSPFRTRKSDISIKTIERILKMYRGIARNISLSGGEPTVREDLPEIIKLVKKYGFEPILLTNGIKLADENYVKKLKDAGLRIVSLSFNGLRDDVYVKMNGTKLLSTKLKAIDNLRKNNMKAILSVTVSKSVNASDVIEIINFAMENDDVIFSVRIRSEAPFGRFIQKNKLRLDELFDLSLGKIYDESILSNEIMFFYLSSLLRKIKPWNRLCTLEFHFVKNEYGRYIPIGYYIGKVSSFLYPIKLLKLFFLILLKSGIKSLVKSKFIFGNIFSFSKKFFTIGLRVWYNSADVIMEEIETCRNMYYDTDTKKFLSLCLYNINKEKSLMGKLNESNRKS